MKPRSAVKDVVMRSIVAAGILTVVLVILFVVLAMVNKESDPGGFGTLVPYLIAGSFPITFIQCFIVAFVVSLFTPSKVSQIAWAMFVPIVPGLFLIPLL